MDHTITIATRQAPIDTLEPPTMGALYRWECSCGLKGMSWKSTRQAADFASGKHRTVHLEAEARVESAASDLLEALHALVDDCSDPKRLHLISLPVLLKVEAAFDKAEGR